MSVTIELTCKKHPKYTAQREPRADCFACWTMYFRVRDMKVVAKDLCVRWLHLPDDCPNCGGSAPA